jgi:DNA-directed RNA polymerase subunit beta
MPPSSFSIAYFVSNLQVSKKMNNSFRVPDFLRLQRESFLLFLQKGVHEELRNISPIQFETDQERTEIHFYADELEWRKPKFWPDEAKLKGQTYSIGVYVPIQILSYPLKGGIACQSKQQKIFLGEIPLMTSTGTFMINGSSRVVVNQLIRSPGVYFKTHLDADNNTLFTASILATRGSWLRIEIDKNDLVWARIDKIRKLPIHLLLYSLGFSMDEVNESILHSEFLDYSRLVYNKKQVKKRNKKRGIWYAVLTDHPELQKFALLNLSIHFGSDRYLFSLESAGRLLSSRFMDPERYDLGALGRTRLNTKLNLIGKPTTTVLRAEDILATVDYLLNLYFGNGFLDDIDDLKNRRVRTSGELIQNQYRLGLSRLERIVHDKIDAISSIEGMTIAERYLPSKFIHAKPIVGTLREFFGSSQLSQYMDQINPLAEITHKRRLSSLGPGGLHKDRAGLAVREIHPSHYGRICPIETPEGGNAGLVSSLTIYATIDSSGYLQTPYYQVDQGQVKKERELYYLSSKNEEYFTISPGDLMVSETNHLEQSVIPIRFKKEFSSTKPELVEFMGISPIQMISVATSLIPFLEHDDANRVLMGSNMQRQAVPLLHPEQPFIGTGLEGQIARDSGSVLLANFPGQIVRVTAEAISIRPLVNSTKRLLSKKRIIVQHLQGHQRSNQATTMYHRPAVQVDDWVEKGDLLADGSATAQGELALGKNILVAYMPWEGYNFEDAVLISQRLVDEDIFTSVHIDRYETTIRDRKGTKEVFTRDIPSVDPEELRCLDSAGMIQIGSWVEAGSILVGKVTPKPDTEETPEQRLLRAIFSLKHAEVMDSSLRVPNGVRGRVIEVQKYKDTVRVYIAENRKIQIGDKVAGRHGNKGIVSNILPMHEMPYLPDGTPVDMVLNPLGVPSRMNVGQVYECLLGLAAKELQQSMKIMPYDEMFGEEASRGLVYQKLYEARRKTGKEWLFQPGFAGKTRLFDGRTGEAFHQPVLAGYPYILKLVHQVDDKIHARSTGPYSLVTQQPLGGRAKHGGQRLGEMEVWALEGFGAAYTLQELLTIKSDDIKGRNDTLHSLIKGVPLPTPGLPQSFLVLISELRALCLDVQLV